MINVSYVCDLCKEEVTYPYGGYFLDFSSGDGAISFVLLDAKERKTKPRNADSIVCRGCVRGLGYAISHAPQHPEEPQWVY